MFYGAAWYPEHWPQGRWATDLALMRETGMNVVRLGEFAWSRLEPAEGRFAFEWLEAAIEAAAGYGLKSVLGTPTAAPPAWLTQAHPEVLRMNPSGTSAGHGARGHFNPASATYLRYCQRIAGAMAERFGQSPHVIGWQIDNEYWPFSYDPDTRRQFQEFLRGLYGTLEALNAAWSTVYWSQEYSDWSQIPLSTDWQNPCLITAFRRFFTSVYQRYQQTQIDAIRAHARPEQFITHNFHGTFEHGDPRVLTGALTFASFDPYVGSGHLNPTEMGFRIDLVRGFKPEQKSLWIMETQPGHVNWSAVNNPLDRGEIRTLVWHQVAHGADGALFWQWRSVLGGQEQYHGTIVGADGLPRPIFPEVQQIGRELGRAAAALDGTTVQAEIALLWSFDDRWALQGQRHHKDFDPFVHARGYYAALREAGFDVDIVSPGADLSGYKLAIAPSLHLVDEALAERLLGFVRGGGHLVLGPRSGMKDLHNALLPQAQPGAGLAGALGAHVTEYYALEGPVQVSGTLPDGTDVLGAATIFAEWLTPEAAEAQVLLRYDAHSWLEGQAAVVSRGVGAGRLTYIAAVLEAPVMRKLAAWLTGGLVPVASITEGVEAARRRGRRGEVLILINHTAIAQICHVPRRMHEVLTNAPLGPEVMLPPHGVVVLREA